MADFNDKIKDGAANASNGMGNFKDDAEDRVSAMTDTDNDTS